MTTGGHGGGLLVWLLRHAKAAADAPAGGSDHARALQPRGRRDAAALGRRLRAGDLGFGAGALPDLVLSSTAARTTETAERVQLGVPLDRRRRLYYGSTTDVLEELRTVDDAHRCIMVVGHNPATHSLALELLTGSDDAGRGALVSYPTCAVALLSTDVTRWRDLAFGSAALLGFARPPYDA